MLISIDWIKEFVELPPLAPNEYGLKLTMATAEVESVEAHGTHLKNIKVAQIKSLKKHPEADKLNLVTFDFGEGNFKEVVCGAPNVREGLKVPYAPIGTVLPGGFKLEPKKIRGILSEGMLCSAEELGLGKDTEGLLELDSNAPIGQNMLTYLKQAEDIILDIDNKSLTHRPDLWGHYGMAREFAAIFSKPLHHPFNDVWKKQLESHFTQTASPILVEVAGESSCQVFYALSVDGVEVGPSPDWMQRRLQAAGLRSINNIVDISNYVMLELGLPLHIYDRQKIQGNKLVIKRLGEKQSFQTLDEVHRELTADDTVIGDAHGPLVLAGIMGGLKSGVSDSTKQILIEVANWHPAQVRRTSVRLGLRSDSSQRFEKSLDSQLCYRTLLRTLELVLKLCPNAKVIGKVESAGPKLIAPTPLKISTNLTKINRVLGIDLPASKVLSILNTLEFKVTENGEKWEVLVPSYRATKDVEFEEDLIEEIGRIIGYDNITPNAPLQAVAPATLTSAQKLHRKIRSFLSLNANALEVMTYPLIGPSLLKQSQLQFMDQELVLVNSLSVDHDRMRPSLIPTHLEAASLNTKNYSRFRSFELGRTYLKDEKNFSKESTHLMLTFVDQEKSPFVELINVMERLFYHLNLSAELVDRNPKFPNTIIPESWTGLHPHEFLNIRLMGKMQGALASVHPLLLRQFKIKGHMAIAILDLSQVENQTIKERVQYTPISKYPVSTFDCTVVANTQTPVGEILNTVQKLKLKELKSIKIADIFHDNNQKFVTITTVLGSDQNTLSSEIIKAAEGNIIDALTKGGFPLKK